LLLEERPYHPGAGARPRRHPPRRRAGGPRHRAVSARDREEGHDGRGRGSESAGRQVRRPAVAAHGGPQARRRGGRRGRGAHPHPADVIAQVVGRLAAKQADRVMIHTTGGVGYEIVVPLGVMERLPAVGETVSLATELVVREDGWSLYGFHVEADRALRQAFAADGGSGVDTETLVRRALHLLTRG